MLKSNFQCQFHVLSFCNKRLLHQVPPVHPLQMGSASLKKVLPAVTGLSYEELPIGKGDDASLAYLDLMFGNMLEEEAIRTRQELIEYCKLDTEGMVKIVEELSKYIK